MKRRLAILEPVVSNTTPLISLVGVGLLNLLPQLYGEIWIPDIVAHEYQVGMRPNDPELQFFPWLKIVASTASLPNQPLDAGETAAIYLAHSVNARLILLDERAAREVAIREGLTVVGTLSVLARAKQYHLITEVKPYVDAMIVQGQYIHKSLREQFLLKLGEEA